MSDSVTLRALPCVPCALPSPLLRYLRAALLAAPSACSLRAAAQPAAPDPLCVSVRLHAALWAVRRGFACRSVRLSGGLRLCVALRGGGSAWLCVPLRVRGSARLCGLGSAR